MCMPCITSVATAPLLCTHPLRQGRVQSVASSILAPSLKHITEVLALTWRARLTRVAHKAYLSRRTFYLTSQFAGMQVRWQAAGLVRDLPPYLMMGVAWC